MNEYLELPTAQARSWIANAARTCGYPSESADALGYLAWWLENRGLKGVVRTCVYLLQIRGKKYDELKSFPHDKSFIAICPVECATLILYAFKAKENDFREWTGGVSTADPLLVGPLLAQMLQYEYHIHIEYFGQHIVFAQDGIAILSDSLTTFHMIDTSFGVAMAVRLVKPQDDDVVLTNQYEKRETLLVPAYRYTEGGGFRFD